MVKKFMRKLDWLSLVKIIINVKQIALLFLSFIFRVEPTLYVNTFIGLYFMDIKVTIVLRILYRLAYQNNSNYLALFIVL